MALSINIQEKKLNKGDFIMEKIGKLTKCEIEKALKTFDFAEKIVSVEKVPAWAWP